MAMEFDRDFNGYLDATFGHGISLTYTPNGGSASTINAILNQEYVDIDSGGLPVQGFQPVAHVKTTDVPNIAFGDDISAPAIKNLDGTTIKAATNYKVINFENDNLGMTQLLLEVQ
jgi:hypothetical protein|tara:strand:- start:1579 stop:1926 length:348 start_codon:yes stop_codon:yes gene_type:complete